MIDLEPFFDKGVNHSLLHCYKELDKVLPTALENLPVRGNSFTATVWTWLQFTVIVFFWKLAQNCFHEMVAASETLNLTSAFITSVSLGVASPQYFEVAFKKNFFLFTLSASRSFYIVGTIL